MASSDTVVLPLRSPSPLLASLPHSRSAIPAEEWLRHKNRITELYLTEGKALAQVRQMLEQETGFKASTKMWKTKLRGWNLDRKNMKGCDGNEILRQVTQLAAHRKPLPRTFMLRGRAVTAEQAGLYLRRSLGMDINHFHQSKVAASRSFHVHEESLKHGTLDAVERFFRIHVTWTRLNFERGNWYLDSDLTIHCSQRNEDLHSKIEFYQELSDIYEYLGRLPESRNAMLQGWQLISPLVQSDDYEAFKLLLSDVIERLPSAERNLMCKYYAAEAQKVLPKTEMRISLFNVLAQVDFDMTALTDLLERVKSCMFDTTLGHFGHQYHRIYMLAYHFDQKCDALSAAAKAQQDASEIMRSTTGSELCDESIARLYYDFRILHSHGRTDVGKDILTFLRDAAKSRMRGPAKMLFRLLLPLYKAVFPTSEDFADDMASAHLRAFSSDKRYLGGWHRLYYLTTNLRNLMNLGENYSELVRDKVVLIERELGRLESGIYDEDPREDCDDCSDSSCSDSDSEWDCQDNDLTDDSDVGPSSATATGEDCGMKTELAAELPCGWPQLDQVDDCQVSLSWSECADKDDDLTSANMALPDASDEYFPPSYLNSEV